MIAMLGVSTQKVEAGVEVQRKGQHLIKSDQKRKDPEYRSEDAGETPYSRSLNTYRYSHESPCYCGGFSFNSDPKCFYLILPDGSSGI
jgi:hypothetical protein